MKTKKKLISIVSPAYNEEKNIFPLIKDVTLVMKSLSSKYDYEYVLVDDGSIDGTWNKILEAAKKNKKIKGLSLSRNFGQQLAITAGLDLVCGDCVIYCDSDLQHPPSLILKLLAEFENGNDVVYTIREETQEQPTLRKLCSDIFYFFLNLISDVPISGNAADFRLISRRVADVFKKDVRERNLFLRGIVPWIGFNQAAVRFTAHPRRAGTSKYSLSRLITFGLSGVVSFSRKPLRLTILTGLLFALFGFLYALFTIIQYLFLESLPSGYATLVVLLSLFSGFQLIFLGIIGEYVGAIFDEVKKRPHYIVDEKINF